MEETVVPSTGISDRCVSIAWGLGITLTSPFIHLSVAHRWCEYSKCPPFDLRTIHSPTVLCHRATRKVSKGLRQLKADIPKQTRMKCVLHPSRTVFRGHIYRILQAPNRLRQKKQCVFGRFCEIQDQITVLYCDVVLSARF